MGLTPIKGEGEGSRVREASDAVLPGKVPAGLMGVGPWVKAAGQSETGKSQT